MSMANRNLAAAKQAKNDEFYTQWIDIEKEMNAYLEYDQNVFLGKTILLPADDPFESNFFKFFATHFNDYGLKKLIATSYDPSPIVNTQLALSLFEDQDSPLEVQQDKSKIISSAYKIELTDVSDFDSNGRVNIEDVEAKLLSEKKRISSGQTSNILSYLRGDSDPDGQTRFSAGDFRSQEVTELKEQADIVITNPPFSLFRVFLSWIDPSKRKFSIIGNVNAITYKTVFPLIKNNEVWLGESIHSGDREFKVPASYPLNAAGSRTDSYGNKYIRVKGVRWFTNINHGRRHQPLSLMTKDDNFKFSKHDEVHGNSYKHYDNYDAIDVPYTDAIPSDFSGMMGVPITFLDKYNPDQFEILGMAENKNLYGLKTKIYSPLEKKNAYFAKFHRNGQYDLNASGVVVKNGQYSKVYQRIFIRRIS